MCDQPRRGTIRDMEVVLRFDNTDPPIGEVNASDDRRPFVGWLELLRVLAELVEPQDPAPPDQFRSGPAWP